MEHGWRLSIPSMKMDMNKLFKPSSHRVRDTPDTLKTHTRKYEYLRLGTDAHLCGSRSHTTPQGYGTKEYKHLSTKSALRTFGWPKLEACWRPYIPSVKMDMQVLFKPSSLHVQDTPDTLGTLTRKWENSRLGTIAQLYRIALPHTPCGRILGIPSTEYRVCTSLAPSSYTLAA